MKNMFSAYYEYNKEEYDHIWNNCIFVVDANVLLNLYRYTEDTRNELLLILNSLSDRLWIPHQVGLEYLSNRISVILEQIDAFDQITNSLNDSSHTVVRELSEKFKRFKKRHPSIELNSITTDITQYFNKLIKKTKENKQNHPDFLKKDPILESITTLFENKVGEAFNQQELNRIFSEGEERYKSNIPPGYKDLKDKKGLIKYYKDLAIKSEYGDLIVWKQIIQKALQDEVSIIFITDDVKEDWWNITKGRTIGPRNELINEFSYKTNNQQFVMYSTQRFMKYASQFLQSNLNLQAIEEVETLSEANKNKEEVFSDDMTEWASDYDKFKEFHNNNRQLENSKEKDPFRDLTKTYKELIDPETASRIITNRLHDRLILDIGSKEGVPLSYIKAIISDELQIVYKVVHRHPGILQTLTDSYVEDLIEGHQIESALNNEGEILYYIAPF